MNRPMAVVGGIRGVAEAVDVSCLLWAGSGIYGVRYLRAISYLAMSQCATGLARESSVCPRRPQMKENKPAHLLLVYHHCPVTQHP